MKTIEALIGSRSEALRQWYTNNGYKWITSRDYEQVFIMRSIVMYYLREAYQNDNDLPPLSKLIENSKPLSPLHRVIKRFNEYRI